MEYDLYMKKTYYRNLVQLSYIYIYIYMTVESYLPVFVGARAFDAALSRGLQGVGEPLGVGADAVELVAEDGRVVERDEDEALVRVALEAVRDAPLQRLLLELARVGHRRVYQLDSLLRDAARVSLGEKFLQDTVDKRWRHFSILCQKLSKSF